jgi:hypothetical protein
VAQATDEQLFAAREPLWDEDLSEDAIAHYACHLGQIVLLAKHLQHSQWRSLSVPRGKPAN